jgi:predicted SnoaL-like aldol condensation-catalyzing enzyme
MVEYHDGKERSPPQNEVVVRHAIEEIWNQGNLDVADSLFAAAYVNAGGLVPDLVRGPEAIKIAAAFHLTAFPRLHITIERMISEGAIVAFQWVARNQATDTPLDHSLNASRQTLRGMTFCRLVSGKIVESWTNWDPSGVLRQLVGAVDLRPGQGSLGSSGLN